ncbi:MAG: 8-oxoguanine deaminase [Candidatus Eisenbacteria bacterium]|nr:8-oxoguanine deaminase [Candidatus Eisenbacteria bacterium]
MLSEGSRGLLLLRNIYHLATMNDAGDRLSGVDVLIDGARVVRIGGNLELPDGVPAGESVALPGRAARPDRIRVIDCSTMLVLPGFVNLHHHFYQTLQRNIPTAQNQKLFDWLTTLYHVWAGLTAEAVGTSTRLACAELLLTGCTMTSDQMYVFPSGVDPELIDVEIAAASELGIRFHPTRGSMSRGSSQGGLPPDSVVQREEAILRDSARLIDRYHNTEPMAMIRIALAPCSPFSVTDRLMAETAEFARDRGVLLHTHLAETADETDYCLATYGKRPLAVMSDFGWVGPDVWFAHGIHFDDAEIAILAETGTCIAHCPTSNMRLSSGVARVPEMLDRGVRVGLAVDGSASNDSSDMLGELRNCLLVQLLTHGPDAVSAEDVVRMATRGGADVLGREDTGSVEEGKAADLIAIDLSRLGYAGAFSDPLAAIVYAGFDHRVDWSIVNGRIVVEQRRLVTGNEADIVAEANETSLEMLEKAGVETPWPLEPPRG